ncbi:peroxisomal membrane protein PEX14-like [Clytia hemisphaerica]
MESENNTENQGPALVDLDEKKVNVAVRFLNNLNVRDTPKDHKMKFLMAKGLNEQEIELAMKKAEAIRENTKEKEEEEWTFWDYFKGIVLSAGILSSANYAYKAYVLPYVAHEIKDDQRIETLKDSVQVLKDDLKQKTYEFTCTLKSIQSLLEDQKKLLGNIEKELGKKQNDDVSMTNIKTDLASLKSMMLSKDKFPAAPFVSTSGPSSAEIPAWQKAKDEKNSDLVLEDGEEKSEVKITEENSDE